MYTKVKQMHIFYVATNNIYMKKILCLFLILFHLLPAPTSHNTTIAEEAKSYLVIVIDDFGEDRAGVSEMLSLDIPLTCAVMPNLTYSKMDAEIAHSKGHEVILHMPLESTARLPISWYGPEMICTSDSPKTAIDKLKKAFDTVPFAKGLNFHMGAALPNNKNIVDEIVKYATANGLYFLDSKTDMHSIVQEVCKNNHASFLERDEFLEKHGSKSEYYARKKLMSAIDTSKQKGYSIVIGHVGPEGGISTYRAIKSMLDTFKRRNVEIVPLSFIYNQTQKNII